METPTLWLVAVLIFMVIVILFLFRLDRANTQARREEADRAEAEKAEAARSHLEAERRRLEEARAQLFAKQQSELIEQLSAFGSDSLKQFELLPTLLAKAEQDLDNADKEFDERAFAPFWDEVENATRTLCKFDDGLSLISAYSERYKAIARSYAGEPPAFCPSPDAVAKLRIAEGTAQRLKSVVRRAQRDFQFSVIYEQRKTNQLLFRGFTTLGQALDRLTEQVNISLEAVTRTVEEAGREIAGRIDANTNALQGQFDALTEVVGAHASESRAYRSQQTTRELKAIEMLDNIQRRRHPGIFTIS